MEDKEKSGEMEHDELNLQVDEKPKRKKSVIYVLAILIILIVGFGCYYMSRGNNKVEPTKTKVDKKDYYSEYRLSGNSLENFDLYFLQLENEEKNKIYSPLSIKYALAMLNEGAREDSYEQIKAVIGEYKAKSYPNSDHMSFANAVFIKESFKNAVRSEFTEDLYNKFGAEVIYDTFETADNFNKWVSDKTFNLIDKLLDDISNNTFVLVNALAIDMEWNKKIQATCATYKDQYSISFSHEKYSTYVELLCGDSDYHSLDFNDGKLNAKSVEIGATLNNYDIVKELGEDNIRKTVGDELRKWLADPNNADFKSEYEDVDAYLDKYIEEIGENYKTENSSTDFMIVDNNEIKAFAKDLKEYDGITLQYVGIMPKNESLTDFVSKSDALSINKIITELKEIKLENFKDGVITKIYGYIPVFNFDYELKLKEDLPKLGIVDIFDAEKANLDGIAEKAGVFIDTVVHKANIDFSNDGIKAAAATAMGGFGAAGGGFDYLFDVPVEEIDMTFDKPYMFLIRDKNTGEVWFTGTVYEPTEK